MKLNRASATLLISSVVSYADAASQHIFSSSLPLAAPGVTQDPLTAANQTFDYIVVGGGLTGLTVASRLSENTSVSVLVVEAGNDNRKDKLVYDMYTYGDAFNTDLVWKFTTEQGRHILGGRTLGGSSSINGGTWTRGAKAQYDAMRELLGTTDADNEWTFDGFLPYMKKAEKFTPPDTAQDRKGANFYNAYHGNEGPMQRLTNICLSPDLNGGNPNCVSYVPHTIDSNDHDSRSSSASAYLTPFEEIRSNWLTLVSHRVTNILLTGTAPKVNATGIQFKSTANTGDIFTATARREVILAAGAIHTPQLLQLSGIGDPVVLKNAKVNPLIGITTVGRNLQEQTMSILEHSTINLNTGGRGPSNVIAFPSIDQLFANGAGANSTTTADAVKKHIRTSHGDWATSQAEHALNADALKTLLKIQADLIVDGNAPVLEVLYDTGNSLAPKLGIVMWNLLPFSRGSVTIENKDPFIEPKTTVNYFSVDMDMDVQIAGARLSRRILNGDAFRNLSIKEIIPSLDGVPSDAIDSGTDREWRSWIEKNFSTVSHPIGTAAMMKRSLGGVVDAHLRVYDTLNLRVVDASVLPLQISAHLSSTLYGIAEKAACMIKLDHPHDVKDQIGCPPRA